MRSPSSPQRARIWGVSDDVNQVSKTSCSPTKPPGLVALGLVVAGCGCQRGIDGEHVVGGDDVVVVLDVAVFVDGVPDGYCDAEVSLSGDRPVVSEAIGPIGVSLLHEFG